MSREKFKNVKINKINSFWSIFILKYIQNNKMQIRILLKKRKIQKNLEISYNTFRFFNTNISSFHRSRKNYLS